ncbi:hypothetical protein AX16_002003 [Volvariella volvacea WC 439]|nr:hypothetical protein AX16_002003 [Volvariella volvacea WC 439]
MNWAGEFTGSSSNKLVSLAEDGEPPFFNQFPIQSHNIAALHEPCLMLLWDSGQVLGLAKWNGFYERTVEFQMEDKTVHKTDGYKTASEIEMDGLGFKMIVDLFVFEVDMDVDVIEVEGEVSFEMDVDLDEGEVSFEMDMNRDEGEVSFEMDVDVDEDEVSFEMDVNRDEDEVSFVVDVNL